ncbi:hypothetical protein H0H87_003297 [Tephrocybe sp. NHM501043]|nr:hypothetical protein H0H87_003297 [Tephrocybe sp. NHM501043]
MTRCMKNVLKVPYIQDAVDKCEESDKLKGIPLVRHILRKSSATQLRPRRKNAPKSRGMPTPLKLLTRNLDSALLERENAAPTHVTPLIASLVQGLVSEELVVVGARPPPENKVQKERVKAEAHVQLRQLIGKAKRERRVVEPVGRGSSYPSAVKINGEIFKTTLDQLGHPQELFWNDICEDKVPWGAVVAKIKVHEGSEVPENPHDYYVKFVYDENQATYTSIKEEHRKAVASSIPPFNCTICPLLEQMKQEEDENQLRNEKGVMDGVAFRGQKYHFEEFVLYHAEDGPAYIGYIIGIRYIANKKFSSQVDLRRVGRISSLGSVLPADEVRDERHLYLTEERVTVTVKDLIRTCHVFPHESFRSSEHLQWWLKLSPYHFYIKWSFPTMDVHLWKDRKRERVRASQMAVCTPCTRSVIDELKDIEEFFKDAERRPLRTLDIFGGVGSFSMGLREGSGCLQITDVVELSPSAAKTVKRNFPNVAVHNRCANEVLRYAIKEKLGHEPEPLRQHYDNSEILPPLEKPDIIVAGVPCQTHSQLNRFKRAGDTNSNMILTALSFVDHLRPKLFYFENVPGFKQFSFDATQATPHTVEGGIPMGGLKFVVRALIDMRYQVRFGLLQAGHYGTPQRRNRFFLVAAADGHLLPELPQPSHDFPHNYGLAIKLESSERSICPIRASNGTAPHAFVSIDDAISDLPRFHWKPPKSSFAPGDGIRLEICDPNLAQCGLSGPARYYHKAKTSFQVAAQSKATEDLQHFTRTFKPIKVKR